MKIEIVPFCVVAEFDNKSGAVVAAATVIGIVFAVIVVIALPFSVVCFVRSRQKKGMSVLWLIFLLELL